MQIPAKPVADVVPSEPSPVVVRQNSSVPHSSVSKPAQVQPVSNPNTKDLVSTPDSTSITFRRDTTGQIYYVLTDVQTGKELREIPPEEVRKVGEGIADYLKHEQEQESSATHIEVKA